MRGDSTGEPELREKHVEHAEKPCNPCAACHEGIHVGAPVPQLFPCACEEPAPEPEHHRCREGEKDVFHPRHVHEQHPQHHERDGKDDCRDSFPFQFPVMLFMYAFCFFVKPLLSVCFRAAGLLCTGGISFRRPDSFAGHDQKVVSCIPDRLPEIFRGAFLRVEHHMGHSRSIVHIRLYYTFHSVQCLVYPCRA